MPEWWCKSSGSSFRLWYNASCSSMRCAADRSASGWLWVPASPSSCECDPDPPCRICSNACAAPVPGVK